MTTICNGLFLEIVRFRSHPRLWWISFRSPLNWNYNELLRRGVHLSNTFFIHLPRLRWYHTLQVKFDLLVKFSYFFWQCVFNISTVINIKIVTNSNQQTQSYKFTSHISSFLSVVLITKMFEICIQTSYDQNVQLILKSYLPVVYGTPLSSSPNEQPHTPWPPTSLSISLSNALRSLFIFKKHP
jgi:hypothetical protein